MSVGSAPTVRSRIDRAPLLRRLGLIGVAAGLLFAVMQVWQHTAGLGNDGDTPAGVMNQVGFTVALVGYIALAVGLYLARPGGEGRVARVFPALLILAWSVFVLSTLLEALTPVTVSDDVIGPLGGLSQAIGLVGLGGTTAVAARWSSWRRWVPLGVAVLFVAVLFVPALLGTEPTVVTESLWALGYSGLGLALYVEARSNRAH